MTGPRQRLAACGLAALAFALTQGSTVIGLASQSRGAPPISAGVYNTQDAAFYLTLMEQARREPSAMLENRFTPHAASPLLMPYWALLGVIGRLLNVPSIAVYIGAMLVAGTALLLAICSLGRRMVGPGSGFLAAALAAGAGGLGWVGAVAWFSNPSLGPTLRSYFPDWFYAGPTWTGVLASSSHPFAVALLLLALLLALLHRPGVAAGVAAFTLAATLGIVHPYSIALVGAVAVAVPLLGATSLGRARAREWSTSAATLAGSGVAAAYYLRGLARDPGLSSWYSQNIIPSPSPLGLLLCYLPLVPLVAIGVRMLWRSWRTQASSRLLLLWLTLPVALAYLPVPFQRRFLDGYYIPVGIAAAIGWVSWRPGRPWARAAAAASLVFLLSLTPLLRSIVQAERLANWRDDYSTLTADEVAAVRWVGERCLPGEVALADRQFLRLWVPFLTQHCRTDAAHPHLSENFQNRERAIETLFARGTTQGLAERIWQEYFVGRTGHLVSTDYTWEPPSFLKVEERFGDVRVLTPR